MTKPTTREAQKGFTLVEMLIVVAIAMIMTGVAVTNLIPAARNARADRAVQTVLQEMRHTRQQALDERRIFILTFIAPRTMRVQRREIGGALTLIRQLDLPQDISYQILPQVPTGIGVAPDAFGIGGNPIDFSWPPGGGTQVYFQPDGSALDVLGTTNSGVIYMGRTNDAVSARAVTMFGATGRVRSFQLRKEGSVYVWR